MVPALGVDVTVSADGAGTVITCTGTRSYTYALGRLDTSTDERGVVRQMHYDAQGRLSSVEVTADPNTPETQSARRGRSLARAAGRRGFCYGVAAVAERVGVALGAAAVTAIFSSSAS
jgi:YD repeat-containing protein